MVERSVTYLNNIKLDSLKGFGEKRYSSLKKSNLSSIADLLRFFPKKHIDRSKIKKIVEINDSDIDKEVTMIGNISKVSVFTTRSRLRITTLSISDNSGNVKAKWFGPQYIESRFKEGDDVALSGKPDIKKTGSIEFKNPTIEKFSDIEELNETGSFIPIYQKIDGMTSSSVRKALKEIISILDTDKDKFTAGLSDMLSNEILKKHSLLPRYDSIKQIHFPKNEDQYKDARNRLALDEFLYLRSIFENLKSKYKSENKGLEFSFTKSDIEKFIEHLPFKLTKSQYATSYEILDDLIKEYPMKRLLQGDVGSGKTVVAAVAIYAAYISGYQVALMAPTEVLAEQHFNSIKIFLNNYDIPINLLTSSVSDRDSVLQNIENGTPGLFIGTHALISKKVTYKNLSLAVIDEQHRFGVKQRYEITQKSTNVNILVMTATPIPRSLALTAYGDMDISIINEKPRGRQPIKTYVLPQSKINEVLLSMDRAIKNGALIYWVCPLIEESENIDLIAVN